MQVPKDPLTSMTALTITPVERAAGVPKLVAGLMLLVTVTEALLSVVADTPPPTKVLTPMVARMPMLTATATQMLPVTDVTDLAPTPLVALMADGAQLPRVPLMPLLARMATRMAM